MPSFDKTKATDEEIWQNCVKEYQSQNPLIRSSIDRYFRRLGSILGCLDREQQILEVGCGAGESTRRIMAMLKGRHFEVSEFDPRYIPRLREKFGDIKITQESVYDLKRDDSEFDCVLLLEVLEHLEDPDLALKELFRVSRRYVVISVPHEPIWRILNMLRFKYLKSFGNTPDHVQHWSIPGLKALVSKYGAIVKVHAPLPWILVLAEKKNAS